MSDLIVSRPKWARVTGFDNVEWSLECTPRPDPQWSRLEASPVSGGRYGLVGGQRLPRGSFWVLFRPALSALNGWLEFPAELGSSCVVCCQWEESLGVFDWGVYGKRYGEIVTVEEVIGLRDLAKRFSPDQSGAVPELPSQGRLRAVWEDLTLFDGNLEGDVAGFLVCRCVNGSHTLLLHGESVWRESFFSAGNRPLSVSEYSSLEKRYC